MVKKSSIKWVIWVLFTAVVFAFDHWDHTRTMSGAGNIIANPIPSPDLSKGKPLFYSTQTHDWVYESYPRAKAEIEDKEPYEDHDAFLKKHVPIYRKKTYWGEEWDERDEDDEVDDDMYQEEGY